MIRGKIVPHSLTYSKEPSTFRPSEIYRKFLDEQTRNFLLIYTFWEPKPWQSENLSKYTVSPWCKLLYWDNTIQGRCKIPSFIIKFEVHDPREVTSGRLSLSPIHTVLSHRHTRVRPVRSPRPNPSVCTKEVEVLLFKKNMFDLKKLVRNTCFPLVLSRQITWRVRSILIFHLMCGVNLVKYNPKAGFIWYQRTLAFEWPSTLTQTTSLVVLVTEISFRKGYCHHSFTRTWFISCVLVDSMARDV